MSNPIPDFDHNGVVPAHRGSPAVPADLSPYPCSTLDLCERFATTPERRSILTQFLDFRARLHSLGIKQGFQWIDGSFLEDVETRENRAPRDIDVVTVYWDYDLPFQQSVVAQFPEFADPFLSKANFSIDHYPFDAGYTPRATIEWTRYWILLFSHNRNGVWKGMLQIDLGTDDRDAEARQELAKRALDS